PPQHTVSFSNATAPTEIDTLSLHDALPILAMSSQKNRRSTPLLLSLLLMLRPRVPPTMPPITITMSTGHWNSGTVPLRIVLRKLDRKSTRLNSSHVSISYAVFCLKKKKL